MRWLVLLVVCASLAFGQVDDRRRFKSDPFNKGRRIKALVGESLWHSGKFFATPLIGIRNLGYDDNVFSSDLDTQNDFSVSPEVGLQTYYRINKNWIWANKGTYNYLYYKDLDQLRSGEYGGETRLYGIFKRVYFDAGFFLRRDRKRINSEINERTMSKRNYFDLHASLQVAPRGHLLVEGRLYSLRFDEGEAESILFADLERDQIDASVRYMHKLKPQFWPFAELDLKSFDFESANNLRDESAFTSFFLGARNEFERRFHYNVKLGMSQLTFDLLPELDTDEFVGDGYLEYRLTRRVILDTGFRSTAVFSNAPTYNYFLSSRFYAGFSYKTRFNFRVGPEIELGENDYKESITPVDELRNDKMRGINLNFKIPIRKNMQWAFKAGYFERDSNQANLSSDGFQFFSDVTYDF